MSWLDHPRPLLRRPHELLDGDWSFGFDATGMGSPAQAVTDRRIRVPFAPETPASGIGQMTRDLRCWYQRTLHVEPPAPHELLLLHFGAVDRVATIWANGRRAGTHTGGYAPFCVDISEAAAGGRVDLVVQADDDPGSMDIPRGKQEWQDEPHVIWYPRTTGIWRSVWLERVPVTRIDTVRLDPHQPTMTVSLHVAFGGQVPTGARLAVRLSAGDRLLCEDTFRADLGDVTRTIAVGTGSMDDTVQLLTWHPTHPVLIDVTLALLAVDGTVLDTVESYTAMRSVRVVDGRFLLNDRAQQLRLVLDQGYWPETGATPPDTAALRRDLELTRALGFDGARKHQKTEDPRYLAAADAMGMLVWAELPSAYRFSAATATNLLTEWAEVIDAHRGHPSVVTWVPVNESWGMPAIEHDPRQRALVRALAEMPAALDGTRPVSANDGWETLGGDIVGIHDYAQEPHLLRERYASRESIEAQHLKRRADGRLIDLEGRGPEGRAVVLSEFGGIAFSAAQDAAAWGYSRVSSASELVARYSELWHEVHESDGLSGACWTQLTDTYQEVNGLLTFDRVPKADMESLHKATRGPNRRP